MSIDITSTFFTGYIHLTHFIFFFFTFFRIAHESALPKSTHNYMGSFSHRQKPTGTRGIPITCTSAQKAVKVFFRGGVWEIYYIVIIELDFLPEATISPDTRWKNLVWLSRGLYYFTCFKPTIQTVKPESQLENRTPHGHSEAPTGGAHHQQDGVSHLRARRPGPEVPAAGVLDWPQTSFPTSENMAYVPRLT